MDDLIDKLELPGAVEKIISVQKVARFAGKNKWSCDETEVLVLM